MSDDALPNEPAHSSFPVIRHVKPSNILGWIEAGIQDTRQAGMASLFYGAFLHWQAG